MARVPAFPEEVFATLDLDEGGVFSYREEEEALRDSGERETLIATYRLVEINKVAAETVISRTPIRKTAVKK